MAPSWTRSAGCCRSPWRSPSAATTWRASCRAPRQLRRTRPPTRRACSASTPSRYRSDRPPARCRALRPLHPGRGHRGPQRHQTRFVAVAPSSITRHGARSHEHRLLPGRRPPWEPPRHPRPVRGPQHQPDEARVAPDEEGLATTASSSTSPATSTTRWWPTAYETSTPSLAGSSSGLIPAAGARRQPAVSRQIEPGRRPTCGSPACDQRSGELRRLLMGVERPVADITLLGREARRR